MEEVASGEEGLAQGEPLRWDANPDGYDDDKDDEDDGYTDDDDEDFCQKSVKVRLCGGVGPMSSGGGTTSDDLDFAFSPFGPTATPVRGRK